MRIITAIAAVWALASPAAAHDFWLHPTAFRPASPGDLSLSIQVGHGEDRAAWPVNVKRVLVFRSIGPSGVADRRPQLRQAATTFTVPFAEAGAHVLALQTNHAESTLPPARFNAFLEEEGLTPALLHRERTKSAGKPGREIYSRRAKALVQVGALTGAQPHVTRPVGLSLEIVPELDPATLGPGGSLPVMVVWEGRPLPGALVKLTELQADAQTVAQQRTDAAGRATFKPPRAGAWLLDVVWTKPIEHPSADFDTTFSSLSFSLAGGRD